ncbi:MAG: sugar phosphate isomerase/epimerase [Clostridia bacterium]|nr:sugar phosphate isomerase/epimerase [Eubacteriales bacterium]NCC47944.1 sugar phosphate isomerase/epimerase [Clostridia bacterium]
MTYVQGLRRGTSLSFNRKIDREVLHTIKTAGISTVELSFGYDVYMNQIDFPRNWRIYADMARDEGVELWSIHLPFSAHLDISHPDDELRSITLHTNRRLIEAAGQAGIQVAVLHPSSEPIANEDRPERMRRSREAIGLLQSECARAGLRLAVENLPRTCLCNRSAEMVDLLQGTGAGIVFDTNHSLIEDNVSFLATLVDSGLCIESLHISDYDFIDERHRLPGDGLNDWKGLFAQLERAGYTGPLLYEVSHQPADREPISLDQLVENMRRLTAGIIA